MARNGRNAISLRTIKDWQGIIAVILALGGITLGFMRAFDRATDAYGLAHDVQTNDIQRAREIALLRVQIEGLATERATNEKWKQDTAKEIAVMGRDIAKLQQANADRK